MSNAKKRIIDRISMHGLAVPESVARAAVEGRDHPEKDGFSVRVIDGRHCIVDLQDGGKEFIFYRGKKANPAPEKPALGKMKITVHAPTDHVMSYTPCPPIEFFLGMGRCFSEWAHCDSIKPPTDDGVWIWQGEICADREPVDFSRDGTWRRPTAREAREIIGGLS